MAVTLIHREARRMNDPHAQAVLDTAGYGLGIALKRAAEARRGDGPRSQTGAGGGKAGNAVKLILGSGSPRRLELLAQIGLRPDAVRPPEIDETPARGELPRPYCIRMAREKALAVIAGDDDIVLCADTTVALGRRIFGKPADRDEAGRFLRALSGRRHRVLTAVAVRRGTRLWERVTISQVRFKRLSEAEIAAYLDTGNWRGKAGGYAIQGPAGAFIPWIGGSFTGIVGLPLAETAGLLEAAGLPLWQRRGTRNA